MTQIITLSEDDGREPVALDFDSTLWDMMRAVADHLAHTLGRGEARDLYARLTSSWGAVEEMLGDASKDVFSHVFRGEVMNPYGLFGGVSRATHDLRAAGARVVIMTHRPPAVAEDVLAHLSTHAAHVDEIRCGYACKIAACREIGARILVEDKPETLVAAHSAGLTPLAIRWPYNIDVVRRLGIPHARSWGAGGMTDLIMERLGARAPA